MRRLLVVAVAAVGFAAPACAGEITVGPVPTAERQRLGLADTYTQYARAAEGIPVIATARVRPQAVAEAAWLIDRMLAGRPDVARAIARSPVRFVVMAHDEFTTDVPEHADLRPREFWDRRARGLGATLARPATSCGEENLLCFPGDPYAAENILVHEFGHTIHEFGVARVDPTFQQRLDEAFAAARDHGRWKGTYAATNVSEYWAEGVQSWLSCNRTRDQQHGDVNSPRDLREHDPPLAALLGEVFGGEPWSYVRPADRMPADRAHLAGFDRAAAPSFDWKNLPVRADVPPAARLSRQAAEALVVRQTAKPSAAIPLSTARLGSLGVPRDAIVRLVAEARTLEPLGTADELLLIEFLQRTKAPEWLALRGRFREFFDLPGLEPMTADALQSLLAVGVTVSLPSVRTVDTDLTGAIGAAKSGSLSLPGMTTLDAETAAAFSRSGAGLALDGITSLDAATASALVAGRSRPLSLNGLSALPDEVATILASFAGPLSLRGIETLSDTAADALATKATGDLDLSGLRELNSPVLATRLARQGQVSLPSVHSLPPTVALELASPGMANPRRSLIVSARVALDPTVAETLARHTGQLYLCGDVRLDVGTARRLAAFDGQRLCFRGLTRLSAEAGFALAAYPRELRFPRLAELSLESAQALATHRGPLGLSGLSSVTPDVMAAIVQHQAPLDLRGIATLTPEAARSLAGRSGDLSLPGLVTLDVAVASQLATHGGPSLALNGVTELPEDAAAALAGYRGQHLDLPALETLESVALATRLSRASCRCLVPRLSSFPPAVASALAAREADLWLPGLTAPTVEVAAALATHRIGILKLPGIRQVADDVAEALSSHQGKALELSGLVRLDSLALARRFASQEKCDLRSLAEISPAAANVLATRPKDLVLPGMRSLSPDVATALARHVGVLSLPGLQELDADVAAALAAHRGGGLGLHGLRRIDPSTATVLAGHQDPIDLAGLMLTDRLDSPEVAALLVARSPNIRLPNLANMDYPEARAVAEVLATSRGRLMLPGLKTVSPATLHALLAKRDADIPELESLTLIPEPDGAATDDFVDPRPGEFRESRRTRLFLGR